MDSTGVVGLEPSGGLSQSVAIPEASRGCPGPRDWAKALRLTWVPDSAARFPGYLIAKLSRPSRTYAPGFGDLDGVDVVGAVQFEVNTIHFWSGVKVRFGSRR